jgi:hypothetical protein
VTYEQFGWKNGYAGFLFGEQLYTAAGVQHVSGDPEVHTRAQWVCPGSGTLADWQERIDKLFAKGAEAQAVGVLIGPAAPLMALISNEGGSVVVYVSESGTGKSMALTAATSFWGRKRGLEIKRETSTVSRGLTYAALGNLPVIFDELRARDPEALRDIVKTYTEGQDKTRATRAGKLHHTMPEWRGIMLAADNKSLVELVTENEVDEEPTAMRILELDCEVPPDLHEYMGDQLKLELDAMSGHAGDYYLRWLLQPGHLDEVRKSLLDVQMSIYQDTGWDQRHRFWVRAITCILVAGYICKTIRLLNFDIERIYRWLIGRCGARVVQRDHMQLARAAQILAQYLNATVGEQLVVSDAFLPGRTQMPLREPAARTRLSVRIEQQAGRILIGYGAFQAWCVKQGVPVRRTLDCLKDHNVLLERGTKVTLGAGTKYADVQVHGFIVNARHPALTGRPVDAAALTPDRPAPIAEEDAYVPPPLP